MGFRIFLIVLAGAVAAPAALFAPSWVDHRNNPHAVPSTQFLDFQSVPLNARAEQLLTIRNNGHTTIAETSSSGVLRNIAKVCPRRLARHRRLSACGFSVAPADDPACRALRPGTSCAVAITFTPRVARRYVAQFCFAFASSSESWRKTSTCLSMTGRGGKSPSAR